MVKRMWTYVSDDVYYAFRKRAEIEGVCIDGDGRVDIGAVLAKLVETYGDGSYTILHSAPSHKADHHERFNPYSGNPSGTAGNPDAGIPSTTSSDTPKASTKKPKANTKS